MEFKRGQVTIFIIISILIIGAVALFFTLRGTLQEPDIVSPEIAPIANFVQECLDDSLIEGIYFISLQGGYYFVPENSVKITHYSVPIHFSKNKANIPDINSFQRELGFYIEQNFKECIYNFDFFNSNNTKITAGKMDLRVLIDNHVRVNLNYPIVIEIGESKTRLNDFESSLDFDFNHVYNIIEEIKEAQMKNPNYVIAGMLLNLAAENDFTYELLYLADNVVVYSLNLNISESEEPYVFSLGAKYDW